MNKKKIKILSLATTYPESSVSSRPKFVHSLNKELVKLGVEVKAITPHSKGAPSEELMDLVPVRRFKYLPEDQELNAISIIEAFSKSRSSFLKVVILMVTFFIFTFFQCMKEKPNILHGHWAFPGGYTAFVMSKIFRKKFIVTIHGDEVLLDRLTLLKKIVVSGLNKSIVVANSDFTKNKLIKMGIKNEKIIIIRVPPDFVDTVTDAESLKQFRQRFVADSSSKIMLFAGRLVELKGAEYAIRSLLELGDLKVHLIIAGEGILDKDLQDLTRSLGLEGQVTFFGGASRQDLGMLRSISDIFVCPSIIDSKGDTDGLPMVIPEAMKAGLPVIGSAVGGIVDILKDEVNGLLVSQKDPAAIASAMRRLVSDEKLRQKIIANSKETLQEFSPELIAKKYLNLYQGLLES